MSLAKKAYKGFKWNALANVLSIFLSFAQLYILVRILEKSDFGIMAVLSLIIAYFISISDFGFENAIIYQKNITADERSGIFSLFLVTGIALCVFCSLLSFPLAYFFEKIEIKYLLWLMALSLFFNGIGRFHKILLSKEMHFKTLAFIQIICVSVTFVTAVILATLGFGLMALICAFLLNSFLENILSFLVANNYYPVRIIKVSKTVWHKFFRLGKYEIGLKLSSMFLRKVDILILGKFFGADLLGGYEVVKNLMNKPHTVVPTIFTEVSYPIYAKVSGSIESITKLYRNQLHLIFIVSAPVYAFLFVMGDQVVEVYLGQKWLSIIPVLKTFALVFLIRSSGIPISGLLMSLGKVKFLFYWNLLASLITLGIIITMLPQKEIGIAKALLIVQLLYVLPVYFLIVKRNTLLGFLEYFKIMIIPLLCAMPSYYLACHVFTNSNLILNLSSVLLLGSLIYSLLSISYLKIFNPELLELIKTYMGKSNENNISIKP